MNPTPLTLVISLCLLSGLALAGGNDEPNPHRWLSKEQANIQIQAVPPPPALHSREDEADFAKIMAAQNARTPKIIAECNLYQGFSYTLFESIYGNNLASDKTPKFREMLKTTLATTRFINDSVKERYKRPRPYQEYPDKVKPLFTVSGYSYPSGHSMGAFTMATVLAEIFPEKKQAFFERASSIAQSRVNAGVHNPSDIKEGETRGRAAGQAILASPSFQSDLAGVKAELQKLGNP